MYIAFEDEQPTIERAWRESTIWTKGLLENHTTMAYGAVMS
jgi:hypothetical protein